VATREDAFPMHPRPIRVFRNQMMKPILFYILAVPFAFCQETQNPPSQTEPVPASTAAQAPARPATYSFHNGTAAGAPPAIFDAGPFGKVAVNGFSAAWAVAEQSHPG